MKKKIYNKKSEKNKKENKFKGLDYKSKKI